MNLRLLENRRDPLVGCQIPRSPKLGVACTTPVITGSCEPNLHAGIYKLDNRWKPTVNSFRFKCQGPCIVNLLLNRNQQYI